MKTGGGEEKLEVTAPAGFTPGASSSTLGNSPPTKKRLRDNER